MFKAWFLLSESKFLHRLLVWNCFYSCICCLADCEAIFLWWLWLIALLNNYLLAVVHSFTVSDIALLLWLHRATSHFLIHYFSAIAETLQTTHRWSLYVDSVWLNSSCSGTIGSRIWTNRCCSAIRYLVQTSLLYALVHV